MSHSTSIAPSEESNLAATEENRYTRLPQSRTQTYDWRTFFLECLYGLLAVAWSLLALAEMLMFKGLTRLEKLVTTASDDLGDDGSGQDALLELASSSGDHHSQGFKSR
jgi:hypothetical protein